MFDHTSRYYFIEVALWVGPDGTPRSYKRRRFLPQPETQSKLAEWPVAQGDRFDLIAARTLGDSQAYWRVADANRVMDPNELSATPGRRLIIPLPAPADGS
jgi:hypothetical protein